MGVFFLVLSCFVFEIVSARTSFTVSLGLGFPRGWLNPHTIRLFMLRFFSVLILLLRLRLPVSCKLIILGQFAGYISCIFP
ncbi:hypothetical protein C8J55DRAFT_531943 [Lentinula edodes]|uniref:Secreted peptide n=1 Tax=Lentinula lateritia TaxID=40482 RepID=A0A9W9DCJ1_9AGAR|nr:hypothetical protein C8J55DRAFT_531943 [Lentinula edodes]